MHALRRPFDVTEFPDPPWYRWLFARPAAAPIWLLVRLYVGWQWIDSGWGKVTGDGWVNNGGAALQGFWERVVAVPEEGRPAITYGPYRDFLQFMLDHEWYEWFAPLIAYSELVIGVALVLGLLTGFAAFGGAFLNFNFMLAGTASTNPVLFLLSILLLLAWKVAGYLGVDRWLLPLLGVPWSRRGGGRSPSREMPDG